MEAPINRVNRLFSELLDAIKELKNNTPREDPKTRYISITATMTEQALAYFRTWVWNTPAEGRE